MRRRPASLTRVALTRRFATHYYSPLMSKALPERILPFRLARHGETLQGSVPIGQMPRLGDLLHERAGSAKFELRFGHDEQGQACVLGRIEASVVMLCQRCLEPMRVELASRVCLALVREDGEIAGLDARYEPLKPGEEAVLLAELVEDEVLLALPNFSTHPGGACEMPAGADAPGDAAVDGGDSADTAGENPFSILESLKSRKPS